MDLTTFYEISLDLIRNNYVAIRIKQYDKNSRKVIIHVTANGQEYKLDETIGALIQVKKTDGNAVANDCEIDLENNTVVANITQQMSTSAGVCLADVSLYNVENNQVLGTMKFNIITDSNAVTRDDIISSSEFNTIADLVILGKEKIEELIALITQSETQEAERQANEEIRKANEITRETNEDTREANELQRQANEAARQEAETLRASSETARSEAETARIAAENKRASAEEIRISSEAARIEAETARANAEALRVTAENERASAETARKEAETARANAETARSNAETARDTAEEERKANEEIRKSNETARIEAESTRATAEEGRVTAEAGRVSAESARAEAETLRSQAETGRADAEASRVAAEQGRVTAENAREELKETVETKLANGEFDGKTVLYGNGGPATELGNDGDVYIDIAGVEPYAHYLFTKDSGVWTPRWTMRGLNGTVVDSLLDNSSANAPSVRAVKEGLADKADKIMTLNTSSQELKNIKLGLKKIDEGNANNIQLLDRNETRNFYPVTLWELISNKPSLATLTNGKLPLSTIPYNTSDFKDLSGNLALNNSAQNLTFELWGLTRKISYTSDLEYAKYIKMGSVVFFTLNWKGAIKENGEYARIHLNIFPTLPPLCETAVTISQWTAALESTPTSVSAYITGGTGSKIAIFHSNGGPAAKWVIGTNQYIKISGFYIM